MKVKARLDGGSGYDRYTVCSVYECEGEVAGSELELDAPRSGEGELILATYDGNRTPEKLSHLRVLSNLDLNEDVDLGGLSVDDADRARSGSLASFAASMAAGYEGVFQVNLVTAGGAVLQEVGKGDEAGGEYKTLASPRPGDLLLVAASAYDLASERIVSDLRVLEAGSLEVAPELPDPSGFMPSLNSDNLPTLRGLAHSTADPDYYEAVFYGDERIIDLAVSSGWLAGESEYSLPDLRDLPGFGSLYLPGGSTVTCLVNAVFSNFDLERLHSIEGSPLLDPGVFQIGFYPHASGLRVRKVGAAIGYTVGGSSLAAEAPLW